MRGFDLDDAVDDEAAGEGGAGGGEVVVVIEVREVLGEGALEIDDVDAGGGAGIDGCGVDALEEALDIGVLDEDGGIPGFANSMEAAEPEGGFGVSGAGGGVEPKLGEEDDVEIGRASCRERV